MKRVLDLFIQIFVVLFSSEDYEGHKYRNRYIRKIKEDEEIKKLGGH